MRRTRALTLAVVLLLCCSGVTCLADGEIVVANHVVARARCAPQGMTITQRVAKVDIRVVDIISYENLQPPEMRIVQENGIPAIYVGKYLFMRVYPCDAEPNNCTPVQLAKVWSKQAAEWLPKAQPALLMKTPPWTQEGGGGQAEPEEATEKPPTVEVAEQVAPETEREPVPTVQPEEAPPATEDQPPAEQTPETREGPQVAEPPEKPLAAFDFEGKLSERWQTEVGGWITYAGRLVVSQVAQGSTNVVLLEPLASEWSELEFDIGLRGTDEPLDTVVYVMVDSADAGNYVALLLKCSSSVGDQKAALHGSCWNFAMNGRVGTSPVDLREEELELEDARLHIYIRNSPKGFIARVGDQPVTGCRAEVKLGGRIGFGVRVLDRDYGGKRPLPNFDNVVLR